MASAPRISFGTLQAGRAIAALAVVGLHVDRTILVFLGGLPPLLSNVLMSWIAALPLLVAAPVLAGLLYHLWFERPALRAVRRYLARGREGQARTAGVS